MRTEYHRHRTGTVVQKTEGTRTTEGVISHTHGC
ncbi:hypothetical protein JOF35_008477 [Streptomyces demainii]|uniref:Uncharacterized protein n=1 Tax=Streptomyces demainii TaxID=588122 RepID=A0ABT9L604_9ACTN|nr:hypothetical protein [Streptomyces demainii]